MRKFSEVDGGNPDGTAKDRVGLTAGTTYLAKYWNDNFFNIFNFVQDQGYSLIDDDLEQFAKASRARYNPAYTYNTSSILTQTVSDVVLGSDGQYYEVLANAIIGDDPVGSVTGNWKVVDGPSVDRVASTSSIQTLISEDPIAKPIIYVENYHTGLEGGGGVFVWDATAVKSTHNGGTVIDPDVTYPTLWTNQAQLQAWFDGSANITTGCWVRKYNGFVTDKMFGGYIAGAIAVENTVIVSSGSNDIDTLTIPRSGISLIGEAVPNIDYATNTLSGGTILVGTIVAVAKHNLRLENLGIDSSAIDKEEGISINTTNNSILKNIVVVGSDENNHCLLVEGGKNNTILNITTIGGQQGVAFKITDSTIENITGYDAATYSTTIRYSPSFPAERLQINNIKCLANLNPTGGGFILMNNESGAALSNITINGLIVDDCATGVQINNTGNATKASNITFDNVKISNVAAYAFQTFGGFDDIQVNNISFINVSGTYYTNESADASRLTIANHKQDSVSGGGLISGSGHKISFFEKEGGGGAVFLQNSSVGLEYYSMDYTVPPVANVSGGTVVRPGSLYISANNTITGMNYAKNNVVKINNTFIQNQVQTIFTRSNIFENIDMKVYCKSVAGDHLMTVSISGESIVIVSQNSAASAVFSIVISGLDIQFKYLFATTSIVSANVLFDRFYR